MERLERTDTSVFFQDMDYYTRTDDRELLVTWDRQTFYVMSTGAWQYRVPCVPYTGFITRAMEDRCAEFFHTHKLFRA